MKISRYHSSNKTNYKKLAEYLARMPEYRVPKLLCQ